MVQSQVKSVDYQNISSEWIIKCCIDLLATGIKKGVIHAKHRLKFIYKIHEMLEVIITSYYLFGYIVPGNFVSLASHD